jgi:hypothetical protein
MSVTSTVTVYNAEGIKLLKISPGVRELKSFKSSQKFFNL